MTTKDLIAAGFKPYQDKNAHRWLRNVYELRVHDRDGVRYVIHVRHCVWPDGGDRAAEEGTKESLTAF